MDFKQSYKSVFVQVGFVALLTCGAGIPSAQAGWNSEAVQWAGQFSQTPRFTDGNLASVWGAVKAMTDIAFLTPMTELKFRSSEFSDSAGVPLYYSLRQAFFGHTHHRPLVVFIPGLFAEHNGGRSRRMISRYAALGYHVVALPNPMSKPWLAAKYKYRPADFEQEAQTCLSLIQAFIKWMGPENVSDIHIVGESYGAFLTSVITYKDSRSSAPLFTKSTSSVTLLGSPENFAKSVTRIDDLIKTTSAQYFSECAGGWTQFGFIRDLNSAIGETGLSGDTRACGSALFAHRGFREPAVDALKTLRDTFNLQTVPQDGTWEDNLTMMDLVDYASPAAAEFLKSSSRPDVGYWLSKTHSQSNASIQVFTANDDYLNKFSQWAANSNFGFNSGKFLHVTWGGHLGYEPTDDFDTLVKTSWSEASDD